MFQHGTPVQMGKRDFSRYTSLIKNRLLKPAGTILSGFIIITLFLLVSIKIPYIQTFIARGIADLYGFKLLSCEFEYTPHTESISFSIKNLKLRNPLESISCELKSIKYIVPYSNIFSGNFYPVHVEIINPEAFAKGSTDSGKTAVNLKSIPAIISAFFSSKITGTLKTFVLNGGSIALDGMLFNDIHTIIKRNPGDNTKTDLDLGMNLKTSGETIPLKAKGELITSTNGITGASAVLSFSHLPIALIPWHASFRGTSGFANSERIRIDWNKGGNLSATGSINLPEAGFILDVYNELKSYDLSGTEIIFDSGFSESAVDIRDFQIQGKDFRLSSSCYIPLEKGANAMSLCVRSSTMPMHRFKALFPAPVTPAWIEKKLLPLFSKGMAKLKHLQIEGNFSSISGLAQKKNSSSLLLDIDLDKISIDDFGGKLTSREVSANVLLEKGRLVVSKINGIIGDSTIKDAIYDHVDTYNENSLENWYISGRFSLPDLHVISGSSISPEIVKRTASNITSIKGLIDGDIKFSYHPSWKYIDITGGRIISEDASLSCPDLAYPAEIKKLDAEFNEHGKAIIDISGKWGSSTGDAKGTLEIFKGNLDLEGSTLLDTKELASLLTGRNGNADEISLKGKQKTLFHLSVSEWMPRISVKSILEGFSGKTYGFIIPPLEKQSSLDMALSLTRDKNWKLDRFVFFLAKGSLTVIIPKNIKDFKQFSFSLRDFDIGKLGIYHEKSGFSFTGSIDGDILIKRRAFNGYYPGFFGELNASGAGIRIPGLPLENKGTGRITFTGQRIYTDNLRLGIGETTLDVFADLKGWQGIKGDIDIKSRNLVLPSIGQDMKSGDFIPSFDSDFARNSDLRIDVDIDSGKAASLKFGQVKANCFFRDGRIDIKNGEIGLNGGELKFRIRQPEEKKGYLSAKVYLKLEKQNLRETFSYFGAEKYLSKLDNATMSSDAYIHCSGKDSRELVSTMGGYFHLNLEDGIIKKSSVLFSILSMLNMEKILHDRPDGMTGEGFYFNNLNAGFKIKDGIFTTRDLVMKSPTINIGATGNIDFNNQKIDMDVVAAPLVTIDSLVSSLPFVGYILTGNDRALLSYYLKVKGGLESPETSYIPLRNIPSSILGYLQRIFMTPGRIPEEFRDMRDMIMNNE